VEWTENNHKKHATEIMDTGRSIRPPWTAWTGGVLNDGHRQGQINKNIKNQ